MQRERHRWGVRSRGAGKAAALPFVLLLLALPASAETVTYTYDAAGRLVRVRRPGLAGGDGGLVPDGGRRRVRDPLGPGACHARVGPGGPEPVPVRRAFGLALPVRLRGADARRPRAPGLHPGDAPPPAGRLRLLRLQARERPRAERPLLVGVRSERRHGHAGGPGLRPDPRPPEPLRRPARGHRRPVRRPGRRPGRPRGPGHDGGPPLLPRDAVPGRRHPRPRRAVGRPGPAGRRQPAGLRRGRTLRRPRGRQGRGRQRDGRLSHGRRVPLRLPARHRLRHRLDAELHPGDDEGEQRGRRPGRRPGERHRPGRPRRRHDALHPRRGRLLPLSRTVEPPRGKDEPCVGA
ncbi:MAG: hypothetical protein EDX89_24595, partial [Acidobacteria bacterium]